VVSGVLALSGALAVLGCASVEPAANVGSTGIPEDQAFVEYRPPSGTYSVKVPDGWARTESGDTTTFTDKLNTISVAAAGRATPADEASGRAELDALRTKVKGFSPGRVSVVHRPAGDGLLVTYRADAERDSVTGKVVNDDIERYHFWHAGQQVTLTLAAPHGSDDAHPWRTVTDSLRWLP
jgi:hypothetical protein